MQFEALFSCLFSNLKDKDRTENSCDWLYYNYHNKLIKIVPDTSIWIPNTFYNTEYKHQLMELTFPSVDANSIIEEPSTLLNLTNLFVSPNTFQGLNIYNSTLNYCLEFIPTNKHIFYTHFYTTHIAVFILKNNQLIFSNIFNFNTKEDILYYLAISCKKHQIDLENTTIYYSGFLREQSKLHEMLQDYFPMLKQLPIAEDISFADAFKTLPLHFYSEVFISPLCE